MRIITPSVFFALVTLALCLYVVYRAVSSLQFAPVGLGWVRGEEAKRLTFAGKRYPMEKSDRLPVLLITLIYALTAFFQLGDLYTPTGVYDFAGKTITVEIADIPVYVTGLRSFSGLGTGSYNIEISPDGRHWSTLWQRHEDEGEPNKVTGYYWADAEGYTPDFALTQKYNELYKWRDLTVENPQNVKYLRITGKADKDVLELTRLCLLGKDGTPVRFNWHMADGSPIPAGLGTVLWVDRTIPDASTWHNSTYFDEIYHARTAKEHIDNVFPYEITHPPLGKLILGLGIRLFGMTPFGWRFSGTLLGVLMLPILYIFLKNLFGKTVVASCGTILFATDFMHLTQTRIATIDVYAVFFILLMYFFMYWYLTLPAGTTFLRGALPLGLSGLFWGLGAASKWTVFYAGIGLAVVYCMGFYQHLRDWPILTVPQEDGEAKRVAIPGRARWVLATLAFSVLCFVVIPFLIYTYSYIPYALAKGVPLSLGSMGESLKLLFSNLLGRLREGDAYTAAYIPQEDLAGVMANNQWYMLTYHQGVHDPHPYSAWWFQWLVDGRPILYYMDNAAGRTTRFAAFANPVLCWTGFLAFLICASHAFRRLWAKVAFLGGLGIFAAAVTWRVQRTANGVFDPALPQEELTRNHFILLACLAAYLLVCALLLWAESRGNTGHDPRAAFLVVGYLSQLLPWLLIGRTTFEYHYFPSLLFLVLALSYLLNALIEGDRSWKLPVYGLTGLSVALYALFYPVLIGLTIPSWYQPLVRWIESWPF